MLGGNGVVFMEYNAVMRENVKMLPTVAAKNKPGNISRAAYLLTLLPCCRCCRYHYIHVRTRYKKNIYI